MQTIRRFEKFKFKHFKEYYDLYTTQMYKTDLYLPADNFELFRDLCLRSTSCLRILNHQVHGRVALELLK